MESPHSSSLALRCGATWMRLRVMSDERASAPSRRASGTVSSESQAALSYCNFEDFLEHLQINQREASWRAQRKQRLSDALKDLERILKGLWS